MIAKVISSFAAGLIVAGGLCGAVYYLGPSSVPSAAKVNQSTEEQMKSTLASAGYVIFTDEEWQAELVEAAENQVPPQEEKEDVKIDEKDSEKTEEIIVYRTILNVASGMTSIDVGHALVQGKIIDDAKGFFNEVEKRNLANDLRPGTYELDSKMTMDEVISIMFK